MGLSIVKSEVYSKTVLNSIKSLIKNYKGTLNMFLNKKYFMMTKKIYQYDELFVSYQIVNA